MSRGLAVQTADISTPNVLKGCEISKRLAVRQSGKESQGLFLLDRVIANETIMAVPLSSSLSVRTKYSIQVAADQHIEAGGTLSFMNHSFTPSVRLTVMEDKLHVIALKELEENSEITFHYSTTESELAHPFVDDMTGMPVRGWNDLTKEERDAIRYMAASYLK